jgi:hypothetical protein
MSQEKTRSYSVGFRQRRYLELQIETVKCILGEQIWP